MLDMLNMTNRMDLLMSEINKPGETPADVARALSRPMRIVLLSGQFSAGSATVLGTRTTRNALFRRGLIGWDLRWTRLGREVAELVSPTGVESIDDLHAKALEIDEEYCGVCSHHMDAHDYGTIRDGRMPRCARCPNGLCPALDFRHDEAFDEHAARGHGNRFIPAAEASGRNSGTEYGRPAPMPLPDSEPSEGREPDAYGVALGDLVVGEDTVSHASRVGVVVAMLVHTPHAGMPYHRYVLRTGELREGTGDALTVTVYERPRVLAPAGEPVECAACYGRHELAERFVECLLAHQRAAREAEAVSA